MPANRCRYVFADFHSRFIKHYYFFCPAFETFISDHGVASDRDDGLEFHSTATAIAYSGECWHDSLRARCCDYLRSIPRRLAVFQYGYGHANVLLPLSTGGNFDMELPWAINVILVCGGMAMLIRALAYLLLVAGELACD